MVHILQNVYTNKNIVKDYNLLNFSSPLENEANSLANKAPSLVNIAKDAINEAANSMNYNF